MRLMKSIFLCLELPAAFCFVGHAQCGPGIQWLSYTNTLIRSGATVYSSIHVSASGSDLPYLVFAIHQHNTLTNEASTITFPDVTATGIAANEAYTERYWNANDYGNQTYNPGGNLYLVDSCTGTRYPPFQQGDPNGITQNASLLVNMPVLASAYGKFTIKE